MSCLPSCSAPEKPATEAAEKPEEKAKAEEEDLFTKVDVEGRKFGSLIHTTKEGSRILLGGIYGYQRPDLLQKASVTHVLTCAGKDQIGDLEPPNDLKTHGIEWMRLSFTDNLVNLIDPHLDKGTDFVKEALAKKNGTVYIHCYQGKSRSSAMLIGACIKLKIFPDLSSGMKTVKAARKKVAPNPNFLLSLLALEENLNGKISVPERGLPVQMPKIAVVNWLTRDDDVKAARWLKYADRFRFVRAAGGKRKKLRKAPKKPKDSGVPAWAKADFGKKEADAKADAKPEQKEKPPAEKLAFNKSISKDA